MSLQYKFFSVPVTCADDIEDEMNLFLRSVQIITIHRELICQYNRYYWAVAVEYQSGSRIVKKREQAKKRVDYKDVLSSEDFSIFVKLREWRKKIAAREAIQLYTVFMNEQLAAMIQKRITTKQGLKEIDGIGEARISKYGDAILAILQEEFDKLEKTDEKGK